MRENGQSHDEKTLERITRIPASIWKEVIPRLLSIGWIRNNNLGTVSVPSTDAIPTEYPMNGNEMKGNEEDTLSSSTTLYQSIINRLNEKAHTSFKASSKATQRLIQARLNEGFKESDFFVVIDFKCGQWLTDSTMLQYLRPSTLFSPKFESYLQAAGNAKVVAEDAVRKKSEERDSRAPAGRF